MVAVKQGEEVLSEPPPQIGTLEEYRSREERKRPKSWGQEALESVLPALVIVLFINLFLAQATRVEGQSMEPNLHPNQRLIIEKVSYRFGIPERGDVVVLKLPGRGSEPLIKRVVGLPGETIEIRGGYVYIDGERLQEPYLQVRTRGNTSPREVCDGCVFVLGDNRNASNDSRFFGAVPVDQIVGRAWIRYWPPSDVGVIR